VRSPDDGQRTFLVTGANTGIGRATAHALACRGGRVLLACRSESKAAPVVDDIVHESGNKRVEYLHLDLSDLSSVRATARSFLESGEPLHVLVNNAGVAGQRGQTAQGFELAFGVNHLGHFLLTTMLLDRLRECAPARIVNVSSDAHYQAKGIDFETVVTPTKTFTGMREYAVSKLCNVLFTQELARRLPSSEIGAHAVHPGVVASDIWRRMPWPARPVIKLFMRSPERGAATSVYCATSEGLRDSSGAFYVDCQEKAPSPVATADLAGELWQRSEQWTHS
jgi:NAD(P)-dependent dehydrogenase (short-subunit alcohol dehydrogenase family)